MTSDAKIGLLLGLVFIFLIAFVINGLPTFRKSAENEDLKNEMLDSSRPPGIAAMERRVNEGELAETVGPVAHAPAIGNPDIAFKSLFPPSSVVGQETDIVKPPAIITDGNATTPVAPGEPSPALVKQEIAGVEPVRAGWPKFHTVVEGDSLWTIAQKFYGPKEGVKQANIRGIFGANRPALASVDDIRVGQKLVIPAPAAPVSVKREIASIFPAGLVEQVESIGERHLRTDSGAGDGYKWYAVREGDSLWKIAAEQLGNGSRYAEIAKLNADNLSDEDSLSVGMRLKLPVR